MATISLWESISKRTSTYAELNEDIDVDVAIVGGGITGLTTAAHLLKAGKKVAIIEAHKIGGVTTAYSTGNLYIPVQPFYQHIVKKFNFETAKVIAESRQFAIDYIEKTIREKKIDCQFARRPWYGYTADHERISLSKEVELLKKMGIPIDYVNELPVAFKFKKAVSMPNQARFNPLQYVISMAEDLEKQGCLIFENTRITEFSEKKTLYIKNREGKNHSKKSIFSNAYADWHSVNPTLYCSLSKLCRIGSSKR